jgi:protein phosphatase
MIKSQRAHLYVAAQTHPGMSGKNNEDSFSVTAYTLGPNNPTPSVFAIVSDGIGGHRAGEVASEMAVNIISDAVANSDGGHPLAVFQETFYRASESIYEQANQDATRKGMGATASCAWIIGLQLYIGYAGDSRIYLMREGKIQQLSRDHTWIQEAIEKGILDREQARTHPNLHVIRRFLGSSEPPEPDLRLFANTADSDSKARTNQGFTLRAGDVVMLCSDGLTDLVSDAEILSSISGQTLNKAAENMIALANQRGGHDNITIVLLGVPFSPGSGPVWAQG